MRADALLLAGALDRIETVDQRSPRIGRMLGDRSQRSAGLRLALVAVVVVIVVGAALALGTRPLEVGGPSPTPLTWTPERLAEDWPAPPRLEPSSGAVDIPLILGAGAKWDASDQAWEGWEYIDPVGDVAAGGQWVDIRRVAFGLGRPGAFKFNLADDVRLPETDPADRWIAYGFVNDRDADGVPDLRFGMDNMADGSYRSWAADLTTGRMTTKCWPIRSDVGCGFNNGGPHGPVDAYYPYTWETWSVGPWFFYSGLSGRFYAWASLIEDGRVVATDFAPDAGWLVVGADPGLPLVGPVWSREVEIPERSLSVVSTLTFTPDGRMLVDACVQGGGTVTVMADTLLVSDLVLGESQCSRDVAAADAPLRAILGAEMITYKLEDGVLTLSADGNVVSLQGEFAGTPP